MIPEEDIYFKKIVPFSIDKIALQFRVSQDLFSSFDVDAGTKLLIRSLASPSFTNAKKVLDLGCGYGIIGIALKSLDPGRIIQMVDRDVLAVEYSKQNAALNGFTDLQIFESLGYDDLEANDFDLITSNIPAKAGESAILYFLQDAACYLKPGGIVAVVVIAPLKEMVKSILDSDPNIVISFHKESQNYSVFHYHFKKTGKGKDCQTEGLEKGVYDRQQMPFSFHKVDYTIKSAFSIPEFDTIDFQTDLVFDYLYSIRNRQIERVLILNPGQGHIPVIVSKLFDAANISIADKDLLSLRVSLRNIILNNYPREKLSLFPVMGAPEEGSTSYELGIVTFDKKESRVVIEETARQTVNRISSGGIALFASGSTPITRLAEDLKKDKSIRIIARKRNKGFSLLIVERR